MPPDVHQLKNKVHVNGQLMVLAPQEVLLEIFLYIFVSPKVEDCGRREMQLNLNVVYIGKIHVVWLYICIRFQIQCILSQYFSAALQDTCSFEPFVV